MAKVIAICGRKGGSGKTTIAVNLASSLAAQGRRTLLVDCDSQQSATAWARQGALPVKVVSLPIGDSPEDQRQWSERVKSADAQYVVLDTPPHLDVTLTIPAASADLVLMPCAPSGLDLAAMSAAVETLNQLREAGGYEFQIAAVPNRVDSRTAASREISGALKGLGCKIAPALSARIAYADAFNSGQWIGDYQPRSAGHDEIEALARYVTNRLKG